MTDAGRRQPAVDEPPHPVPEDAAVLAAPRQRAMPEPAHLEPKHAAAPGSSWAPRSSGCAHSTTERSHLPTSGTGSCMRRRSSAFTSFSFACSRLRIVCRSTVNRPLLLFFAADVREAEEVERLRLPFAAPLAGCRPRTARTPAAASSRDAVPAGTSRIARAAPPGTARHPTRCWKPTTMSSAYRTTITSPCACFRRHAWTHRSNT